MLLLAVNREFSGKRDVLADWEAEDILRTWEGEAVTVCIWINMIVMRKVSWVWKYIAVLWLKIVFSLSSNSCSSFGLRTLETSIPLY